ncbi:MAG TPA: DUF4337 domain-containing protein [Stellaceae bacterium]|nr:DUF4337 domain-containing protein [Stellaceae bacterium]
MHEEDRTEEVTHEAVEHASEDEGLPHVHHGHAAHASHATHGASNTVALLVTFIAALLAVTEISGKGAQTEALVANVNSNDQWSYYNAKDVRKTVVLTAADMLDDVKVGMPAEVGGKIDARVAALRAEAGKYETDPGKNGKKEIREKAEGFEKQRDESLEKYHTLEFASAAYELAIVLCSISLMLNARFLVWLGGGLGAIGLALSILGWFAPGLIELP